MKYFSAKIWRLRVLCVITAFTFLTGCNLIKKESKTPTLLKNETAKQSELMKEVNRFARVSSLRAKMDLKFEDNSFAEIGIKESFRDAPGEIVVQRPGKIRLTVQMPAFGTDIVQMSSDGETFRVAILQDNSGGKFKKFVKGTNNADYSILQKSLDASEIKNGQAAKENVNAFANLRPQHFTDAMLVRPTDDAAVYTQSSIYQIEEDTTVDKRSHLRTVMRGYYFLDEFVKQPDGSLLIARRFWFDRVIGIRLARQQIFDGLGEIESDIVYGREGNLTETGNYTNLPLQILVTRPKEKYSMRLTYQTPESVMIGNVFKDTAFVLENSWKLEEVDLDKKLAEAGVDKPPVSSKSGTTFFQKPTR